METITINIESGDDNMLTNILAFLERVRDGWLFVVLSLTLPLFRMAGSVVQSRMMKRKMLLLKQ